MKNFLALLAVLFMAPSNAQELEQSVLAAAEQRGRQLFLHDHAAAIVSDAVVPLFTDKARQHLLGYITEEKDSAIVVTFFGTGDTPRLVAWYRAAMGPDGRLLGPVAQYEGKQALSTFEERAAAARQTGMTSNVRPCSQKYNSVVLPKTDGWQVYLIPGTTERNVVPFGGTYRIDTDASGRTVTASRGFTKSCLTLSTQGKEGDTAIAIVVSHLLDLQPTEAHVFWQLWSRKEWRIVTVENRSTWSIDKGRISFAGKISEAQ